MNNYQIHVKECTLSCQKQILNILANAATKFNLKNNTSESQVIYTLISYVGSGFGFGLRISKEITVIDFIERNYKAIESQSCYNFILENLRHELFAKVSVPCQKDLLPLERY